MSVIDCFKFKPNGNALANLQRHIPTGIAWDAYRIPGKKLFKLLKAFSSLYDLMSEALCELIGELNPFTTERMIEEWERALGLPDPCLPDALTLEERRFWVVWRLTKRRWTTAEEWKELASYFGLTISITPGWLVQKPALYAFSYPRRYDLFPKLGRFRVYIDVLGLDVYGYPYGGEGGGLGYPIPYGISAPAFDRFRCLIDRVKPANVVVIWNSNPLKNYCYSAPFSDDWSEEFCGEGENG